VRNAATNAATTRGVRDGMTDRGEVSRKTARQSKRH